MKEVSAGGVVVENNDVLLLKKFRGEWVLPKGRLDQGESIEEAAIREVQEESGIFCEIVDRIGYVKYTYKHYNGRRVQKTVYYFYMHKKSGDLLPQKEEGFQRAIFMPWPKALSLLTHNSERDMVENAFTERRWKRD